MKRLTGRQPLIQEPEIREVIEHALAFQEVLVKSKAAIALPEPGWYPFDSFGTMMLLDALLTGMHRFLGPMIGDDPVLDVGCGDGSLAFLFESLGCRVCAVDHASSNYNRMRGVKALKSALRSSIRIEALDLDRNPRLPVQRCGLALFFGVLYHLKNPFAVMESLGERARYCLLSTAVTRFAPGQEMDISGLPLAVLVGRDGLGGDETNYWVFSEASLRTLIDRTGWEVCDWLVLRDESKVLWHGQTDERAFCLLRSRSFPNQPRTQLADGWHALENGAWRWTKRRFSVVVAPDKTLLRLSVTVPEILPRPLTLAGAGHTQVLRDCGDHECSFALAQSSAERLVEFELESALAPDEHDARERGIIVRAVEVS